MLGLLYVPAVRKQGHNSSFLGEWEDGSVTATETAGERGGGFPGLAHIPGEFGFLASGGTARDAKNQEGQEGG